MERTTWERIPRKCDWSPQVHVFIGSRTKQNSSKNINCYQVSTQVQETTPPGPQIMQAVIVGGAWSTLTSSFEPSTQLVHHPSRACRPRRRLDPACEHSRDLIGPDRGASLAHITKRWCGTNEGCGNHPSCLVLECEMIKSGVGVCKRSRPVERTVWETSMRARRMATRE